jgi:hypothetical protein
MGQVKYHWFIKSSIKHEKIVFENQIFRIFGLIGWAIIPASWIGSKYFFGLNHWEWNLFKKSVSLETGLNFIYFKMYDYRGIFFLMKTWSEHSRAGLVKVSAKSKPIALDRFKTIHQKKYLKIIFKILTFFKKRFLFFPILIIFYITWCLITFRANIPSAPFSII